MAEYTHGRVEIRSWPDFCKDELEAVINNLRPSDLHEAAVLGRNGTDVADRCRQVIGSTPLVYLVCLDGQPVFIWGATALLDHFVVLWGFGTVDTPKVVPAISRYLVRRWLASMGRAGVSRIEARLPTSCSDSLRWLKSWGMREECVLLGATVNGEPLTQLSYTWNSAR